MALPGNYVIISCFHLPIFMQILGYISHKKCWMERPRYVTFYNISSLCFTEQTHSRVSELTLLTVVCVREREFICPTLVVQPDSSSCKCFHGDGLICVSRWAEESKLRLRGRSLSVREWVIRDACKHTHVPGQTWTQTLSITFRMFIPGWF